MPWEHFLLKRTFFTYINKLQNLSFDLAVIFFGAPTDLKNIWQNQMCPRLYGHPVFIVDSITALCNCDEPGLNSLTEHKTRGCLSCSASGYPVSCYAFSYPGWCEGGREAKLFFPWIIPCYAAPVIMPQWSNVCLRQPRKRAPNSIFINALSWTPQHNREQHNKSSKKPKNGPYASADKQQTPKWAKSLLTE